LRDGAGGLGFQAKEKFKMEIPVALPKKENPMSPIVMIIILLLLFGGGGYYGCRRWGSGGASESSA